ncbi:hypothetical protein FSP39_024992 [Pinctada imbricata]|uniref:Uncharacterized protein n=1 Tax=Pinctada imbricata TaxID=66713 RepID=A0AA88XXI2_PINIB|nr:hypothetical protein FSP39_024992 [Pinctada imbricata]
MWILKNSKELLEHLKSTHFSRVHSIKAFDFSTLYTTIPHSKLKERLAKIISNAFTSKNGNRKYKFIVVNYDKTYFVKEKSDSENKYTETDIIQMLNFLIDNIFVVFGGKVFQQIVGIPMGTNCAPLLADIFLYSYEAEFIQSLVSEGKRYLASDFNFTYRYIDDVLSINNPKFADYLSSIYPSELEVKETTETNNSASYLDIMLSYDTDGHMNTSLYDKRDDFNFSITNFPFLSSNIPSSPAYGVFISQLIRYARASTKYTDFVLRARRLSDKLLSQGYVCDRLTSSLRKFYGRYGELVIHYDVPLSRMVDDILGDRRSVKPGAPSEPNEYNFNYQRRGLFIIINNKRFHPSTGLMTRDGTNADAERLEERFQDLGFMVRRYDDVTSTKLTKLMNDASEFDHSDCDCFGCAILSHGVEGRVYATDGMLSLDVLILPFRGDKCPTLVGKPKLFFLQACRCGRLDVSVDDSVSDRSGFSEDSEHGVSHMRKIPVESDFLFFYSTVPGRYSWRNHQEGTWFIQALCIVLENYGNKMELVHMLTQVNRIVAYEFESCTDEEFTERLKQMPCIVSMLTRYVHFRPKKPDIRD